VQSQKRCLRRPKKIVIMNSLDYVVSEAIQFPCFGLTCKATQRWKAFSTDAGCRSQGSCRFGKMPEAIDLPIKTARLI
jgi:hypothetical protein